MDQQQEQKKSGSILNDIQSASSNLRIDRFLVTQGGRLAASAASAIGGLVGGVPLLAIIIGLVAFILIFTGGLLIGGTGPEGTTPTPIISGAPSQNPSPPPIITGIASIAQQILGLLQKGTDGLYNFKIDEPGVFYWCTYLIVDAYNNIGITGLNRIFHGGVINMKNYFSDTIANNNKLRFLSSSTSVTSLRSGDVIFFEGSGSQHANLVSSVDIDENGNGVIHTLDSNNVFKEDVVFVKNYIATKAQTTQRLYSVTGYGQITGQ